MFFPWRNGPCRQVPGNVFMKFGPQLGAPRSYRFKCCWQLNPLPCGTLATFFLTAVGPMQHTKEDDIGREKTILMTSLRLERAPPREDSNFQSAHFPPHVGVSVNILMWWRKCGPTVLPPWEGGDKSGRRCRTWPPLVSLEPAWKDASIDTSNTLIWGLWDRQNYFD